MEQNQEDVGSNRDNPPFFSVITPAYNAAPYIRAALASAFAQSFRDFELIVVNDGSPDTTALEAAIEPFRHKIRYVIQENRGASGARNTAIGLAKGVYLAFLDADDIWESNCLESHHAILRERPNIDVLYGDGHFFGDPESEGKRMMTVFPSEGQVTLASLVSGRCIVFEPAAVAKRETVEKVGRFDESLPSAEDLDLWLRILTAGGLIEYHTTPVLRYRRHGDSLSADAPTLNSNVIRVLERVKSVSLTAEERELVDVRVRTLKSKLAWRRGETAIARGEMAAAAAHWAEAHCHEPSLRLWVGALTLRFVPGVFVALKRVRAARRGASPLHEQPVRTEVLPGKQPDLK